MLIIALRRSALIWWTSSEPVGTKLLKPCKYGRDGLNQPLIYFNYILA